MANDILVIDVGTSSMRATLMSAHGAALVTFRTAYAPTFLDNGWVEQDPAVWTNSLVSLTRLAVSWAHERGLRIDAVALTSQRSSAIAVDACGCPLHPAVMWQDTRTNKRCDEMREHAKDIYALTGLRNSPVLAAPKFSWLKRERPQVYKRAHKILTIADYLTHYMTGRFVTDYTYGSRTLLMNLHNLTWDAELLRLFDLDREKLCDLTPQGSAVGATTDGFAALTGLRSGTPLISAGGDQQCGALGASTPNQNSIQITTGTGSFVIAPSEKIHLDPSMRLLCSISAMPGQFTVEASIPATAALYGWLASTLFQGQDDGLISLMKLGEEAAVVGAGANGVMLLPHFQGSGSPDWNPDATGTLANITLATTRGEVVRASLEGIAAEIADNVDLVLNHLGETRSIVVSGGLTNLALFNQIQADMFNLDVYVPLSKESTTLGAWISASVATGIYASFGQAMAASSARQTSQRFAPNACNLPAYNRLRETRNYLHDTLTRSGLYSRLRELRQSAAHD